MIAHRSIPKTYRSWRQLLVAAESAEQRAEWRQTGCDHSDAILHRLRANDLRQAKWRLARVRGFYNDVLCITRSEQLSTSSLSLSPTDSF